MMKSLKQVTVGQPFIMPLPQVNFDGGIFEWRKSDSPWFVTYLEKPTSDEIKGFKNSLKFALNYQNGVIWILFRTSTMNWSGCPFSLHLLPEGDRPIIPNEITSESRLTAMGVMIDSRDNKVMAIKDFTFEPDFTQKLYEILKKQEHNPLGTDELGSIIQRVYRDPDAESNLVKTALAYSRPGY